MTPNPTDRIDAPPEDGHDFDRHDPSSAHETPQYHGARAALYGAVAAPFVPPDEGAIDDLAHDDAIEGILTAAKRVGVESETAAFVRALETTDAETATSAYDRLFGVPDEGGTYPVVPYEAQYTVDGAIDREQRRIAAVIGVMEAAGFERGETFAERQDHVAAELELAQVLAVQRAVALHGNERAEAGRIADLEATFLAEHLIDFVPAFARDLRDATDVALYETAADLARALVELDHERHPGAMEIPTSADRTGEPPRNDGLQGGDPR